MEREEEKTRRKQRRKNNKEFIFCRFPLALLSEQGTGDVNVCPGIKRPLIVCFQAVIENRVKTYFHLGVHSTECVLFSAITAWDNVTHRQTKRCLCSRGRLAMNTLAIKLYFSPLNLSLQAHSTVTMHYCWEHVIVLQDFSGFRSSTRLQF